MQGVIPAAGEGSRLRPLTAEKPKPLVEVAGRPLLAYALDALLAAGIEEVVIVIGYRGDRIRDRFGGTYRGASVTYAEQPDRRGLADAVLTAEPHVDGPFVEHHGDNLLAREDVERVAERHRHTDAVATLGVESVDEATARETGVCVFEEGELVGLVEKPEDPPSTVATAGVAAYDPLLFHACHLLRPSGRGEYELPDAIELLVHAGHPVETVELANPRINVNTPADLDAAQAYLREHSGSED